MSVPVGYGDPAHDHAAVQLTLGTNSALAAYI